MKKTWGIYVVMLILAFILSTCSANLTGEKDKLPAEPLPTAEPSVVNQPTNVNQPAPATVPLTEPAPEKGGEEPQPGDQKSYGYEEIKVSPEQAYDIFKGLYPQVRVKQLELDRENHPSYVYEVEGYEGATEYEVKIDAYDGSILKVEQGVQSRVEGEILKDDLAFIPGLIDKALQDAGEGYRLKDWEVELRENRVEFEVELLGQNNRKVEYRYDIRTGDLLRKGT